MPQFFARLAGATTFTLASLSIASPPAVADILAPVWTGAYIGVHGGAQWGEIDVQALRNLDTTAVTYGGHAGYNLGLGPIVIGIEGDIGSSQASWSLGFGSSGGTANIETDWSGTLRARVGVPLGPVLLYATAGYAWTRTTLTTSTGTGTTTSSRGDFGGPVYGLGAEAFVLPNLSLRLEALRFDLGDERLSFSGAAGALQEVDAADTVVRAGVTFHLN